jgi:ABC-2 type transport system permease protein
MTRLAAFLRKDLLVAASYRLYFVGQLIGVAASLLTLWFLSRLFQSSPPAFVARYGSADYFAFAVVGMALLDFMWVALGSFSLRLRELQVLGTLEAILATPASAEGVVFAATAYAFLWSSLRTVIYLGAAHLVFADLLSHTAWGAALVVWLLAIAVFTALGLFAAGITLLVKAPTPITGWFGGAFFLFGGVLYPVEVLPAPLDAIARYIPMTLATTGLRRAFLSGAGLGDVATEVVGLALYAAVLIPAAVVFLRWAFRRLRAEGSIGLH